MKIDKLYFKWNRNLDSGIYQLDEVVSEEEKENNLIKNSLESWYTIKSNENVRVKIDAENRVKLLFYIKNSKIGKFEISSRFIEDVKREFELYLEACEKDYKGDKLILHFGDSHLQAASLIRKQN